jgi:glutathione S-transferase
MNPWTALTTLAALFFYLATGINVARSRRKHGLHAPSMAGHPVVERALRVQGNTLEWLVVFIPSLWIFSGYWGAYLGAALGVVWILGRIVYMAGYMQDAAKRGPGFGIQFLATAILLIGALAGAIRALMAA